MESFKIITTKTEITELVHNDDLSDREGYNPAFLSTDVPIPKIIQSNHQNIAQNTKPGKNGAGVLDYLHFSVVFNKTKKLPFFTAVNIEGKTNSLGLRHEEREGDSWYPENRIKIKNDYFQFGNDDYRGSGFQRGHMVRYYDPAWGKDEEIKKQAMGDTFHYTNCCPQLGKYNAGLYNDLEDYYMARAIFQDKKMTVFSGPIFNKAKTIKRLLVPVNFWKVLVYVNSGKLEAMGFLISYEMAYGELADKLLSERTLIEPTISKDDIDRIFTKKNIKQWMVKISLIEEKTGIDFKLNQVDINLNQPRLFYDSAVTPLTEELERMRHLALYEHDTTPNEMDYSKFINDI